LLLSEEQMGYFQEDSIQNSNSQKIPLPPHSQPSLLFQKIQDFLRMEVEEDISDRDAKDTTGWDMTELVCVCVGGGA